MLFNVPNEKKHQANKNQTTQKKNEKKLFVDEYTIFFSKSY